MKSAGRTGLGARTLVALSLAPSNSLGNRRTAGPSLATLRGHHGFTQTLNPSRQFVCENIDRTADPPMWWWSGNIPWPFFFAHKRFSKERLRKSRDTCRFGDADKLCGLADGLPRPGFVTENGNHELL